MNTMTKTLLVSALAVAVQSEQVLAADSCPRVEAFYATWDLPLGGELPIEELATDKLTHVILAFGYPEADGSLNTTETDRVVDQMVAHAHANNTGVLLSVGGAGVDFLSMDAQARLNLVDNIVAYAAEHKLDGIDIDWEDWSTYGQPNPEESERLLQFMADVRAALPEHLTLSVDVQAGGWSGVNFHEDLDQHADIIRFMAYDYTGGWGGSPINHHAAWEYIHGGLTATWEGSHSMIRKYDVDKTSLGLPFYNRVFRGGTTAGADFTIVQDIVTDLVMGENVDYNLGSYVTAEGDAHFWETPNLIQQKSQFVKDGGYPGVFIWELHQDSKDENYSLLSAISQVLPKCGACEQPWQFGDVYMTGDRVTYQGRNYQVAGGPLHSVAPETLGHKHRFIDLGPCQSNVVGE